MSINPNTNELELYWRLVASMKRSGHTQEQIDAMLVKPQGAESDVTDVEFVDVKPKPKGLGAAKRNPNVAAIQQLAQASVEPLGDRITPEERQAIHSLMAPPVGESQATESESQTDSQSSEPSQTRAKAKDSTSQTSQAKSSEAKSSEAMDVVVVADKSIARTQEHQLRRETARLLCDRVAHGEAMMAVCKDADMPSTATFLRWAGDDPEIARMYTTALQMRAAGYADELVTLADKAEKLTEPSQVQALKLMVNTRQWVAARLLPKVYGEHTNIEHTHQVQLDEKQINSRIDLLVAKLAPK